MRVPNPRRIGLAVATALLATGCGGQGAGDPANRTLNVYAAAEAGRAYSHAEVAIQRIVVTNGITSDVLYNAPTVGGLKIDLETLHGKLGPQYLFLGSKEFSAGLFTNAEITVANEATVVLARKGEKRTLRFGDPKQLSVTWKLDYAKTKPIVPGTNLILDFDLTHWSDADGMVKAPKDKFLLLGDGGGLMDPQRHVTQTLTGIVQDLTGGGGTQDFTLLTPSGTLEVRAKPAKDSPTLTEGTQVQVTGTYDPAAGIFNADKLQVPNSTPPQSAYAGSVPPYKKSKNQGGARS